MTRYDELVAPSARRVAAGAARTARLRAPISPRSARHAYTVGDADVRALKDAGHSEDEIFEQTVSAAVAAGLDRLDAALDALR